MDLINHAWLSGNVAGMTPLLHPDIVMALPGFSGEIAGREKMLEGFEEFCRNAQVLKYRESDHQIRVVGNVAIASFHFEMLYERPTYRERSKGRDVWVFHREGTTWVAVWRTMLDVTGEREQMPGDAV